MNKLLEAFKGSDSSLNDAMTLYKESLKNDEVVNTYVDALSSEDSIYTREDFFDDILGVIGHYYVLNPVTTSKPVVKEVKRQVVKDYNDSDIELIVKLYRITLKSFKFVYGKEPMEKSFEEFKRILKERYGNGLIPYADNINSISRLMQGSETIPHSYRNTSVDIVLSSCIMYNLELFLVRRGFNDVKFLKLIEGSIMRCRNHEKLGIKQDMIQSIIEDSFQSVIDLIAFPKGVGVLQKYLMVALPIYGSLAVRTALVLIQGWEDINREVELYADWIDSMSKYCELVNYPDLDLHGRSIPNDILLPTCLIKEISVMLSDDYLAHEIAEYCGNKYQAALNRIKSQLGLTEAEIFTQMSDVENEIMKITNVSLSTN